MLPSRPNKLRKAQYHCKAISLRQQYHSPKENITETGSCPLVRTISVIEAYRLESLICNMLLITAIVPPLPAKSIGLCGNPLEGSFPKVNTAYIKKSRSNDLLSLCRHYLFSREAALQVFSARVSLTTVFGMGTGGPSA